MCGLHECAYWWTLNNTGEGWEVLGGCKLTEQNLHFDCVECKQKKAALCVLLRVFDSARACVAKGGRLKEKERGENNSGTRAFFFLEGTQTRCEKLNCVA